MAYPGNGAPPAGGYGGGYLGFPGGYPAGGMQQDPLYRNFLALAGGDQKIDATILEGFLGSCCPISLETCRLMIAMLNPGFSGKIGFNEFEGLFILLNQWQATFMECGRPDESGTIELHEFNAALRTGFAGYSLLSPNTLNVILQRYSTNRFSFDSFVACCVRLKSLTDQFRRRDTAQNGMATFQYDDFIQMSMYC